MKHLIFSLPIINIWVNCYELNLLIVTDYISMFYLSNPLDKPEFNEISLGVSGLEFR
jgi:hypothetical protein